MNVNSLHLPARIFASDTRREAANKREHIQLIKDKRHPLCSHIMTPSLKSWKSFLFKIQALDKTPTDTRINVAVHWPRKELEWISKLLSNFLQVQSSAGQYGKAWTTSEQGSVRQKLTCSYGDTPTPCVNMEETFRLQNSWCSHIREWSINKDLAKATDWAIVGACY